MKTGSLVECIDNSNLSGVSPKLELNTPYTVEDVYENSWGAGVDLEGITAIDITTGRVAGFKIARFRELQLPDGIEEILKQELVI